MSSAEDKQNGPELLHTRARRRYASLEVAGGFRIEEKTGGQPWRVSICPMDKRTYWKWQEHGTKSKGGPMFEQEDAP